MSEAPLYGATEVDLVWVEDRINHWIRFGRWRSERVEGRRKRVVAFDPGIVFAYLRWEGNEYGTVVARLTILRACRDDEPRSTVPGVRPGGELLLRLEGWKRVQRALTVIDAVEELGIDAAEASPDYWRHVHNRLSIGTRPRPYEIRQHRAWLRRRSLGL